MPGTPRNRYSNRRVGLAAAAVLMVAALVGATDSGRAQAPPEDVPSH